MFIRKKGRCFYVVENLRVGGKVKQKVLACLGRTTDLTEAIARNTFSIEVWGEPDEWDRDKQCVGWAITRGRLTRTLSLRWDNFTKTYGPWRTMTHEQRSAAWRGENREISSAYYAWRNAKIDAHLKVQHKKRERIRLQRLAQRQANLANLWKLVPEAERAAMEIAIEPKVTEKRSWWPNLLRAFAARQPVVPEMLSQRDNSGTTQEETAEPDVVPERRTAVPDSGTTQEWYGS